MSRLSWLDWQALFDSCFWCPQVISVEYWVYFSAEVLCPSWKLWIWCCTTWWSNSQLVAKSNRSSVYQHCRMTLTFRRMSSKSNRQMCNRMPHYGIWCNIIDYYPANFPEYLQWLLFDCLNFSKMYISASVEPAVLWLWSKLLQHRCLWPKC